MKIRTLALAGLLAALPMADAFATIWTVTGTGEPASISSAACDVSNNCPTLRDAINSAVSGDTIQFSNAIDGSTIVLSQYSDDLGASARASSEFGPSAFFFTGGKSLTLDGKTGLTRGITIARDTTQAAFRLFDIDNGSGLTLQSLTLKNGLAQGFSSGSGGGALGAGGAIFNQGTLSIDSCTFAGNAAQGGASGDGSGNLSGAGVGSAPTPPSSGGYGGGPNGSTVYGVAGGFGGGGIAYDGGSSGGFGGGGGSGGIGGNGGFGGGAGSGSPAGTGGFGGGSGAASAGGSGGGMGGAIFNDAGSLTIVNSTFTANSASGGAGGSGAAGGSGLGGAIFNYSAILNIQSSTLARNSVAAANGGSSDGGAVYSFDDHGCNNGGNPCSVSKSTFDLENSIFSNSEGGTHDIVVDSHTQTGADIFSGLIMMSYDSTQFTTVPVSSADPLLSPLGHYGGPMPLPVLVPHKGSPAINSITCVLAVDQRGVSRPQPPNTNCDVGAVEYDGDYIFANGFD